jgi:transcriptional regulator GlxA family with amidase domain
MFITIVALPDAHAIEIAGLRDTFNEARLFSNDEELYQTHIVCEEDGPLRCSSGLRLLPDATINDASPHPIDTIIVVGGDFDPPAHTPKVTDWVRYNAQSARRIGSVCTGAFALGAAGLLDGRKVTTHWEHAAALTAAFPGAIVESDRIFLRDGRLITSAGETSAMDMALALVEEDCGRQVALAVARRMVMFLKRPGSQPQISVHLAAQIAASPPIQKAQTWVRDHPTHDLSVVQLARIAGMSGRNFSRVFHEESGMTPGDFVEWTRVESARALLEDTELSMQRVARASGFNGSEAMRRAFLRRLRLTPVEFRNRMKH